MPKQVMFSDEGRAALLRGVNIMAAAVKATMGPKGRNVVIDKKFGSPTITKDGVTVAKEIELKDNYEDMGAQMLKEVASKTSDIAGDGTTTATVLAQAIFKEGLKNVTAGANPMGLKRGIDAAVEAVVAELKKLSKSTKDKKEVIAALHASYDHARKFAKGVSDADLAKEVDFFGQKKTVRDLLMLALEHSHEHLGQEIAYARMNGVKPPWS